MAWFKKNKENSCCNVKIEEVKENNEEKSSCCDVKIEKEKENK